MCKCPRCGYEIPEQTYEYDGYLKPHLETILLMLRAGKEAREISEAIGMGKLAIPMIIHIRGRYGILTADLKFKLAKEIRNAKITGSYHKGNVTITALAKEYGLSTHQTSQIIKRQKQRTDSILNIEDVPIDTLGLSMRTKNCLLLNEFKTVGDVMKMNDRQLLRLINFGRTSLAEWKLRLVELRREYGSGN
jgi:hypothetical protein